LSPRLLAFRWLVAACQAATIAVTWGLWQRRDDPPLLPALPLPPFDLGPALLVSLVAALVRPAPGLTLHTAVLAYAVATDQTRLQPQTVSLLLLLWSTVPGPGAALVGRAHLIALWTWAGIHKLLSPTFIGVIGPRLVVALVPWAPPFLAQTGGYAIAAGELTLGLLALVPRTRRLAAGLACVFHASLIVTLALLPRGRNVAVWPWNAALAFAGVALLVEWSEPLRTSVRRAGLAARTIAAALLLLPAGFYLGLTDAYLAHNLYAGSAPRAVASGVEFGATVRAFHVILPPEPRLYAQYFQLRCRTGDVLRIHDPRAWARWRAASDHVIACGAPPAPGAPAR
jgi:hypothetical protein